MSRIGKQPVPVPDGVEITIDGSRVTVKSKLGQLERSIHPSIRLVREGGDLLVQRQSDTMQDRALHGLTRALVANMVTGVAQGFSKVLLIEGTGYRAETQGDALVLNVGYSHPVRVEPKLGITFDGVKTVRRRSGRPFHKARTAGKAMQASPSQLGERSSSVNRLYPDAPERMYIYRFNVVLVEG